MFLFIFTDFLSQQSQQARVSSITLFILKQPRENKQPFHSIKAEAILTCTKTGRLSNQIPGRRNTNSPQHQVSTPTPIHSQPPHPQSSTKYTEKLQHKVVFTLKSQSRVDKMKTFLKMYALVAHLQKSPSNRFSFLIPTFKSF